MHALIGKTGALAAVLATAFPALAACPIELAVYGDLENTAGIDFRPTMDSATVTNSFRMVLDNGVVLDGIVQWSDGVARPNGMLMHKCPEGDVTGEELAACTVWQGVIYTSDDKGNIELLPAEGKTAPQKLDLSRSRAIAAPVVRLWRERFFEGAMGCFCIEGLPGMTGWRVAIRCGKP